MGRRNALPLFTPMKRTLLVVGGLGLGLVAGVANAETPARFGSTGPVFEAELRRGYGDDPAPPDTTGDANTGAEDGETGDSNTGAERPETGGGADSGTSTGAPDDDRDSGIRRDEGDEDERAAEERRDEGRGGAGGDDDGGTGTGTSDGGGAGGASAS